MIKACRKCSAKRCRWGNGRSQCDRKRRDQPNFTTPLLGLAILSGRSRVGIGGVGVLPRNVGRMKHPGCCRSSSDTAHIEVHILDVLFSRQRGGKEQAVGVEWMNENWNLLGHEGRSTLKIWHNVSQHSGAHNGRFYCPKWSQTWNFPGLFPARHNFLARNGINPWLTVAVWDNGIFPNLVSWGRFNPNISFLWGLIAQLVL